MEMKLEIAYTCDRCASRDVSYQDWFPIAYNLHWCRACVTRDFNNIPGDAKARARRWRDNDWENWTPAKRAGIFNRMRRWLNLHS